MIRRLVLCLILYRCYFFSDSEIILNFPGNMSLKVLSTATVAHLPILLEYKTLCQDNYELKWFDDVYDRFITGRIQNYCKVLADDPDLPSVLA